MTELNTGRYCGSLDKRFAGTFTLYSVDGWQTGGAGWWGGGVGTGGAGGGGGGALNVALLSLSLSLCRNPIHSDITLNASLATW